MREIDELAAWLSDKDDIVILTHIHPDGDALGTSAAIAMALAQKGKRAMCVCDDPVPGNLSFLPVRLSKPESLPFAPQYALLCDAGDAGRAGRSGGILEKVKGAATLDHHGTSQGVGEIQVICPQAAASGVIALQLIRALKAELTKEMATCLYAAISTDTGNFSFRNTNAEALRAAADCVEAGIPIEEMNFRLFRARRRQKTRLIGAALQDIQFLSEGRIGLIRVTAEKLAACEAASEDVDTIVNYAMDTQGVEIAILLEQRGEAVKASLRSRGEENVAALVLALGGGGHKNAAGVTLSCTMEEACRILIPMAERQLIRS